MEKKEKNKVLVGVLALAALLGLSVWTIGGDLEPSAPLGPTMKTLDEIYNAATSGIEEREGFCQTFEIADHNSSELLSVPSGKQFVLLRLDICEKGNDPNDPSWKLYASAPPVDFLIYSTMQRKDPNGPLDYRFDFPDRCAVVHANQTLAVDNYSADDLFMTLVGYFRAIP